jgi:hypothetical protein
VAGLAIITEACIDVKDRACVDVCPVQCIFEFDAARNILFSEEEAGSIAFCRSATWRTCGWEPTSSSATRRTRWRRSSYWDCGCTPRTLRCSSATVSPGVTSGRSTRCSMPSGGAAAA